MALDTIASKWYSVSMSSGNYRYRTFKKAMRNLIIRKIIIVLFSLMDRSGKNRQAINDRFNVIGDIFNRLLTDQWKDYGGIEAARRNNDPDMLNVKCWADNVIV